MQVRFLPRAHGSGACYTRGMKIEGPKRPGGELQGRNVQGPNGTWVDKFNEPLGAKESTDMEYAAKFWNRQDKNLSPKYAGQLRESMRGNIESAVNGKRGSIGSFVDPTGVTEEDKEKLSAYRVLAKEMGYEVGDYAFDKRSHVASAQISKKDSGPNQRV